MGCVGIGTPPGPPDPVPPVAPGADPPVYAVPPFWATELFVDSMLDVCCCGADTSTVTDGGGTNVGIAFAAPADCKS